MSSRSRSRSLSRDRAGNGYTKSSYSEDNRYKNHNDFSRSKSPHKFNGPQSAHKDQERDKFMEKFVFLYEF